MNNMNKSDHLVDFSAFKKSTEEKVKTANMKRLWKKNMLMYFGSDWRKYNNYPFTLKAT